MSVSAYWNDRSPWQKTPQKRNMAVVPSITAANRTPPEAPTPVSKAQLSTLCPTPPPVTSPQLGPVTSSTSLPPEVPARTEGPCHILEPAPASTSCPPALLMDAPRAKAQRHQPSRPREGRMAQAKDKLPNSSPKPGAQPPPEAPGTFLLPAVRRHPAAAATATRSALKMEAPSPSAQQFPPPSMHRFVYALSCGRRRWAGRKRRSVAHALWEKGSVRMRSPDVFRGVRRDGCP